MKEHFFKNKDIILKYKEKPSSQDRRHLLVIFSGFKLGPMTGYDFQGNAVNSYKGHVLWIKDDFDDLCSYYLCKHMDFSIEEAVINLIYKKLDELRLGFDECTLAGFSKGGTAALYFGIKYNFKNIISTVPRFKIGSFVSSSRKTVASHMMGDVNENNITILDNLLEDEISADNNLNRNIYLFSSEADIQYKTEIKPNLHRFDKYNNFNFILTNSSLVREHNEVTRYNIPLILSIMYSLCEGCPPSYGFNKNGGHEAKHPLEFQAKDRRVIANLKSYSFKGEVFYPEGDAFILGIECPEYGTQSKKLLLEGKKQYQFEIGSTKNKKLSWDYFTKEYIDYYTAGFATLGHKGINLSDVECGLYDLTVNVNSKAMNGTTKLKVNKELNYKYVHGENLYHFFSNENCVKLIKRPVLSSSPNDAIFTVANCWHKDDRFHIEGVFLIAGIELENWNDALYLLTIKNENHTKSYQLGMCHKPFITEKLGDGFSIYDKAYYSTLKGAGVDIKDFQPGCYHLYLSMSHKKSLFTKKIERTLVIS